MTKYDIMQVDDDVCMRNLVRNLSRRKELSYHGVGSLNSLEASLKGSSAKAYLVDGKFPSFEKGKEDMNAPGAFELIRAVNPEAYIMLYSSEKDGRKIADEHGVDFMSKTDDRPKEVVDAIDRYIHSRAA